MARPTTQKSEQTVRENSEATKAATGQSGGSDDLRTEIDALRRDLEKIIGTLGEMMDALGRAANAALKHIVVMAEAAELVKQAEELRGKAYFAALSLEASAKGEWSSQAVEQAKRSVGW